MKKFLTTEEREARKRAAFAARGIDYDRYCRECEQEKLAKVLLKQANIERNMLQPNHEDNVQFGSCNWDVADCLSDSFSFI